MILFQKKNRSVSQGEASGDVKLSVSFTGETPIEIAIAKNIEPADKTQ